MVGYTEARLASKEAEVLYRDGYSTLIVKQQMQLHHPGMNGFERNRAAARAFAAVDTQINIRGGFPPLNLVLPYPLPPSSVGAFPPPNNITLDAKVLITQVGVDDEYKIARAKVISGDSYATALAQINFLVNFWRVRYPLKTFTIIDPASSYF